MRRNGPGFGRLLGLPREGGTENLGELTANLIFADAGRQIELDENRLPITDTVNEPCPRVFIDS